MSKNSVFRALSWLLVIVLLAGAVFLPVPSARAAQMTARSLTLTSSAGAATSVDYTFAFTAPTATTVKSVRIDICDSASGTCSPPSNIPSGFSSSSAAVGTISGIGSGGSWTGTFTTNGRIDIANASNTGSPSTVSIQITGITNPTTNNSTFYARMTTYSASNWTGALDSGTVAASTASQITVTASVDETLTFCAGTSITGQNCGTISGSSVNLGTLTDSSTGSGTSVMAASTNGGSGYAITINGTTLTSGGNSIDAITAGSGSVSSQSNEQFGINVRDNATPNVGADPSGATSGITYGTGYGTADTYKFVTGNTVASKAAASNGTTYTVSYIANIAGTTEPGTYTGTYTYICTATF